MNKQDNYTEYFDEFEPIHSNFNKSDEKNEEINVIKPNPQQSINLEDIKRTINTQSLKMSPLAARRNQTNETRYEAHTDRRNYHQNSTDSSKDSYEDYDYRKDDYYRKYDD